MDEQKENLTTQSGPDSPDTSSPDKAEVKSDPASRSEDGAFRAPVEYASPMKRLWAWVGVIYAVGWALLMTFALAHGDLPQGIGALLTVPALAGLGGSVILRYAEGKGRGGLPVCVLLSGASFALALWNLIRGLPVLLAQL